MYRYRNNINYHVFYNELFLNYLGCIVDSKKVQWMLDTNGNPWTWIMGEHKDDKTIEQIIEEEAREAARIQAEHETEQLRFVFVNL